MKTTKIELLSPAKNLEVGLAAINHGADAVYIGGPAFGAREKAGNSIEDIEKLCDHAHLFGAKVYVTLNTLLNENELEPARQLAWDCWNAGVDALIVQDLNLLNLDLPPIPLHASTQCDNLTLERVQELESLGFEQVVLGRELAIDQIREIRSKTTVPLEFFVHGSLCVSHSGQCYLSEYIGNRSANRGACAQPCRLPWDLLDAEGKVLVKGKHLLCLKDLNNSAHLEELMDAGITSFKIEGRLKEADYVKNITAYYRQQLDAIFERRPEFVQASLGHCSYTFEVNPEKSFNRGFTDYFIHGRQPGIGSPHTPKSMGEYIGEVKWCNSVQMEILTDKTLHNGDGLCFLNQDEELIGIRADVVRLGREGVHTISTNRPHGAFRGAKIYRNYDIEWQRQVDASKGNRKIDIELALEETEEGFVLSGKWKVESGKLSTFHFPLSTPKIPATNPEKALENIRKKLSQWGDTIYNPINIDINLSQPYLISASVLGEMKRGAVELLKSGKIKVESGKFSTLHSPLSTLHSPLSTFHSPLSTLMSCHHCIRYANGLCPKETGKPTGPLFIRNGQNTFRLEFDCKKCLMYVCVND
ncbi:MAG: U32 family peptidase [Bacteroidales bacterium]|nr:U32 family peptidase [Bacteroidales bacterium]